MKAEYIYMFTAPGHLLVNDAAAGGHPLHVTRTDQSGIPQAIAMVNGTFQHVGDGFDPPVRVHRKASNRTLDGIVKGEVVEQEKRIKQIFAIGGDGTPQQDAGPFNHLIWLDYLLNCSWIAHTDSIEKM
jgi:hypothetical protein